MASTRAQEIRVGIVSVIAILVLVVGILWGKRIGFGVDTRRVLLEFPNANGVEPGTIVTLNGVRKGSIVSVQAEPHGVRMEALIDPSIPLHADASASIRMLEITGGKKVELKVGEDAAPLPADAVIHGKVEGDIATLMAAADGLVDDAKSLFHRLDSTITLVTDVIGTEEFRSNVRSTLANVEDISTNLREMILRNRPKLERTLANVDDLSRELKDLVERSSPKVDQVFATIDQTAGDARSAIHSAQGTLQRADSLIVRLDNVMAEVESGEGIVTKLIYDKEFADELDRTLKSAKELVEQIKKYGINANVSLGAKP